MPGFVGSSGLGPAAPARGPATCDPCSAWECRLRTPTGKDLTIMGTYKIDEQGGVLSVKPDDGKGNPMRLSPTGWLSVEVIEAAPAAFVSF